MDIKTNAARNSSGIHLDKNIITELVSKYKELDIAVTDPEWDEKKQNYKKVYYWKDKPKVNGAAALNSKQLIIRNTNEYPEVDWDIFKHLEPWQAQYIKDKLPKTFEFGRDGRGHSLYKVKNLPENPESTKSLELGARTLLEYRAAGSYSIFAGQLDKTSKATTAGKEITEIDYKYLKKLFNRVAALAALTLITPGKKDVINNFLLAAAGEFYQNKISEKTTIKIFKSWLHLISRTDRENETVKSIEGIYKSGRASNIFSKNYPVPISDAEKYQFREIVIRVGFTYEPAADDGLTESIPTADEPTESIKVYRLLDPQYTPTRRAFVMEGYLKEGCMTLNAGEPGSAKTTWLAQKAYCFAGGHTFFGKKVTKPGNALIITAEEEHNEMELRLRAVDKAYGGIKNGNIIDVICYDTNFKLVKFSKDGHEKTKHFVELEQLIIKNNYKFIGLDPLISLQTGSFDENNNPQMDAFCKSYLMPLAQKHGACVSVNHHTNKLSMITEGGIIDNNALHAARGASALVGAARIVIALSPMTRQLWEKSYKKIVKEDEIKSLVAIIDAKNNYSALGTKPKWLKKEQKFIDCKDGQEPVAILTETNIADLSDSRSAMSKEYARKEIAKYITTIDEFMKLQPGALGRYECTLHGVSSKLANKDPRIANEEEKTLVMEYRRTIQAGLQDEIKFNGFYYWYDYDPQSTSKAVHKIFKEEEKTHDAPAHF